MHRHYLDAGYRVFALHRFDEAGCGCGNPECKAAGKHPISRGWTETPIWDDDQLETFESFGQFEQGFGVLVSDGLLVIDVDARNGGVDALAQLGKDIPEVLRAGFCVQTGSGGGSQHIYFKVPDGVALQSHHADYKGIDFKSSGFVVGAGSQHASGGVYKVLWGEPCDITPAPKALIDLLRKPETIRSTLHGEVVEIPTSELPAIISHISPDCSYDEWIRAGMAIHHATGGTGFDIWDKWSRKGECYPGRDRLDHHWHSFGKTSAPPVTVGTIIKMASDNGYIQPVTFDSDDAEPSPTDAPKEKSRAQKWLDGLLEDDDDALDSIANQPWLIDGIIPAGAIVGIVGESGAGKSFAALDMACCIALGCGYHGHDTDNSGTVIYVSAEGAAGLRVRKRGWEQSHGVRVPDMRILADAPLIDDKATTELVTATINELAKRTGKKTAAVIFDTLNRVMQGEENSATAIGAVLRSADTIRNATGAAVKIIHHTGHGGNRARGSSAFYAGLDVEIIVRAPAKMTIALENTKQKDAEAFKPFKLHMEQITLESITDHKGRPFTTLVPSGGKMALMEDCKAVAEISPKALDVLALFPEDGSADKWRESYRGTIDKIGDGETRASFSERTKKSFSRHVDALIRSGHIAPKDRMKKHYLRQIEC